jgi:hypothetical protein
MIRVLFRFDRDKWVAFPNDCQDQDCLRRITSQYPSHARWFIGFNGRKLATLKSHSPADFEWYANVGLQEVDQQSQFPKIGAKSKDFGGFTGEAVYRPLVANSGPFFTDPEGWKRAVPPKGVEDAFRAAFRHKSPKFCPQSEDGETPAAPVKYENSQVQIKKAYRSNRGTWIAEIHLNDPKACEYDRWFVVAPDGSAAYLDEGVWLVDAGDFNKDGESEVLFSISRYDRGGYELFYDHSQSESHSNLAFTDRGLSLAEDGRICTDLCSCIALLLGYVGAAAVKIFVAN